MSTLSSWRLGYYFKKTYTTRDVLLLAFCVLCTNIVINFIYSLKGFGYPYNTFLFIPEDRFADFFKVIDAMNIVETWPGENPYDFYSYYEYLLPFTATFYFVSAKLIQFIGSKYAVYNSLYLIVVGIIFFISRKSNNKNLWILIAILSYPFIYTYDRGNLAIVVFISLLIALSTKKLEISTLGIAIATSIKLTPIIFLLPVLLQRNVSFLRIVKLMGLFLFWFLTINFISVQVNGHFLSPTVYDPVFLVSSLLNSYSNSAVNQMIGLPYNSSFYMLCVYLSYKLQLLEQFLSHAKPIVIPVIIFAFIGIMLLLKKQYRPIPKLILALSYLGFELMLVLNASTNIILVATLSLISLTSLYFLIVSETSLQINTVITLVGNYLTFEKMTFLASISFVLFMPVTADYYLIIMLLPLLIFPNSKFSLGYFFIYGLLLGAKNFLYITGTNISYQVFLNPILLLLMLFAEFELISFFRRKTLLVQGKFIDTPESTDLSLQH